MAYDRDLLAEARAALRPFALMIAFIPMGTPDDAVIVMALAGGPPVDESSVHRPPVPVLVGDIRRAAAFVGLERHEGRVDSTRPMP